MSAGWPTSAKSTGHNATHMPGRDDWDVPYDPAPLSDDELERRTRWHLDETRAIRARWLASGVPTPSDQWWAFWSAETRHWQQLALNHAERTRRVK